MVTGALKLLGLVVSSRQQWGRVTPGGYVLGPISYQLLKRL